VTSAIWNFAACLCDGLKRKFTVSGTMALGTCNRTFRWVSSHAIPKSRVTPRCVCQFFCKLPIRTDGTSESGPSIFKRANEGRHIVCTGMDADFKQHGSRRLRQIRNGVTRHGASARMLSALPVPLRSSCRLIGPQNHLEIR
jgi:hypothetical protein